GCGVEPSVGRPCGASVKTSSVAGCTGTGCGCAAGVVFFVGGFGAVVCFGARITPVARFSGIFHSAFVSGAFSGTGSAMTGTCAVSSAGFDAAGAGAGGGARPGLLSFSGFVSG